MKSFPQLRKDPIVDRWVLIAPERGNRPFELAADATMRALDHCPFCEGEEARTPREVLAVRAPGNQADGPGWSVRVVPNMFPAARSDAVSTERPTIIDSAPGYGVHEIIVESPQHERSLANLAESQVRAVFDVYRRRLSDLSANTRLQYVQAFKNHGAAAGATVEHVHSQILGVPFVPREIMAELTSGQTHHATTGRCIYCDLIQRELVAGSRAIADNEHCVVIAAVAGRFPYETWILPRRHDSDFRDTSDAVLAAVADAVRGILRRLEELVKLPSYNLALHTAPLHDGARPDYHWHWELLPRLTGIAGFELSTGWFINPLPPEIAAERLRG